MVSKFLLKIKTSNVQSFSMLYERARDKEGQFVPAPILVGSSGKGRRTFNWSGTSSCLLVWTPLNTAAVRRTIIRCHFCSCCPACYILFCRKQKKFDCSSPPLIGLLVTSVPETPAKTVTNRCFYLWSELQSIHYVAVYKRPGEISS